jgi:hypothetical protein
MFILGVITGVLSLAFLLYFAEREEQKAADLRKKLAEKQLKTTKSDDNIANWG